MRMWGGDSFSTLWQQGNVEDSQGIMLVEKSKFVIIASLASLD